MFGVGLNTAMVLAMQALAQSLPSRLDTIQTQLFACIQEIFAENDLFDFKSKRT